jgi:CRISPR/Cas system CMR subunit Cmr6 (Cas7 group RAMP superfamily)
MEHSELEDVRQDIQEAKAALKRAEDRNDRDLILEREKRLNLLLRKEERLTTGEENTSCSWKS